MALWEHLAGTPDLAWEHFFQPSRARSGVPAKTEEWTDANWGKVGGGYSIPGKRTTQNAFEAGMQRPQRKVIEHETAELAEIMQSLLGDVYDFILKVTEVLNGGWELSVSCNQSDGMERLLWSRGGGDEGRMN